MAEVERMDHLRQHMVLPDDQAQLKRIWRGIGKKRHQRRTRRRLGGAALVMAVVLPLVVAGAYWRGQTSGVERSRSGASGPLRLASGAALPNVLPSRGVHEMDDGSALSMNDGARLEVLHNGARDVVLLLQEGQVELSVAPEAQRRWTIDCGVATVEVVGTRFRLDRESERLRVEVIEGLVIVRGEHVPSGLQRIARGGSLEVSPPSPRSAPRVASVPGDIVVEEEAQEQDEVVVEEEADEQTDSSSMARGTWHQAAREREFDRAYEMLQPRGVAAASRSARSVEDLLALADVARNSGHPEEAVFPLEIVLSETSAGSRAPLSAFTLGRLCLERLGRPGRAAWAFERAIDLGLPAALVEDALHLKVVSLLRAGDRDGARRAGQAYLSRFPNGPHAQAVLENLATGSP